MTDEIRRALCKHNKDNPSLTQKQLQEWVHSNYGLQCVIYVHGANGLAGANGSINLEASMSNGFGELNEVGELSGGQAVKPRWVNDKSHDHMGKYQEGKVKSHGRTLNDTHKKIAQKLHDEEVQKATAKDRQEKADMERSLELQR
nr:hypothetical protein [Tanacetum cinerariifolium]